MLHLISIKMTVATVAGAVGSFILAMLGGWDNTMTALIIFMAIDIITGLMVAAVFKTSTKTDCGTLSSKTMSVGLCRKGAMLLIILGCAQLDIVLNSTYIRDAVIIAFCANEFLSVIENVGLMGVKFPSVVTKAIELLKVKSESTGADSNDN